MTPLHLQARATDRGFERLYRRHAPDVYRYALAVLRNPDDAEDVTQTTFMNAYRAFVNGERPKAPKNWLIAIAHNVCRQRFRLASRRPSEVEFDEELTAAVPTAEGPSAGDIRRALGHLAFNQRAALVMRELEGRSYAEIASILGLSVGAVETLIFRARRALREQLEEALTCDEAEFAISRQLDGRLPRNEKGRLRAHLRACEDCAAVARSQRAQRSALRGLAGIPLPSSIASFFGGGGGAVGAGAAGVGLAAKVALLGATAVVATGVGYEGVHHKIWHHVVSRGQVAQAGRPVSVPVGQPATKLFSDLRPPSHDVAAAHARTARPKQVVHGAHAAVRPVARATKAVVAPAAPAARQPRPHPAAKAVAKKAAAAARRAAPGAAPVSTPPAAPPPPPSPPASPPPAAAPAPAPAPKRAKPERRRHGHHHRVAVAPRRDDEDADDQSPAPAPHKPCKPHHARPHRERASTEATVAVRVRPREHHHSRDHDRAAAPPPPRQERRHDDAGRHDHDGRRVDHGGRGKRQP